MSKTHEYSKIEQITDRKSKKAFFAIPNLTKIKKSDKKKVDLTLAPLLSQWPGCELLEGANMTRISAVGAGMPATIGTAAKIFRALASVNININMIVTSEIRTSCVVAQEDGVKGLRAIHNYFKLYE